MFLLVTPMLAFLQSEPPTPTVFLAAMALGCGAETEEQAENALKDAGMVHADGSIRVSACAAMTGAYRSMLRMLQLPTVQVLALLLITGRVAFSGDGGTDLELLSKGVPESWVVRMNSLLAPVDIAWTMLMSGVVAGTAGIRVWKNCYWTRLALNIGLVVLIHSLHGGVLARWFGGENGGVGADHDPALGPASAAPWWWWGLLVILLVGWRLVMYLMFVS